MSGQLDFYSPCCRFRASASELSRRAYRVPTNQFIMFDDRMVHVETISAE
jgi:hypothetical protein